MTSVPREEVMGAEGKDRSCHLGVLHSNSNLLKKVTPAGYC